MYMPVTPKPDFQRKQTQTTIDPKKLTDIRGFEFSPTMMVKDFVKNFHYIGFQASHLSQGVDILREATEDKCEIYLYAAAHTGTSGLREMIAQLIRDKKITCLVATAGLIEEDIMKTFLSFKLGEFDANDEEIKANKISRIGNIFIPDDYYLKFEAWHNELMQVIHKEKKSWPAHEYIKRLGMKLKDENSIVYWAAKRNVNIIVPDLAAGTMGMHWNKFNQAKTGDKLDIDTVATTKVFNEQVNDAEKIAGIIIGGDLTQNPLISAARTRKGLDYTVFIKSIPPASKLTIGKEPALWDMVKNNKKIIHIDCDATIAFPLLMTGFYS